MPSGTAHAYVIVAVGCPTSPVTVEAKTLLPDWDRRHGERTGLPERLIQRAVAVAGEMPADRRLGVGELSTNP